MRKIELHEWFPDFPPHQRFQGLIRRWQVVDRDRGNAVLADVRCTREIADVILAAVENHFYIEEALKDPAETEP